jgi:hypothetical protein
MHLELKRRKNSLPKEGRGEEAQIEPLEYLCE